MNNLFFKALLSVLVLDFIWLYLFNASGKIYMPIFNNIQGQKSEFGSSKKIVAFLTWVLLALSISEIAYPLSKNYNNIYSKVLIGSFVGFIVYGIFNGTNYAIFNKYPFYLLIIDTLWGSLLSGISTYFLIKF